MDGLTVLKYREHIWTLHCSPLSKAKPVLLIALFEMVRDGQVSDNKFYFSKELCTKYLATWEQYFPTTKATPINYPLYHLTSDKFWHFCQLPNTVLMSPKVHSPSIKGIKKAVDYFYFDKDLFEQLQDIDGNKILSKTITDKYL